MADAVNVFPPGLRITDSTGTPVSNATVEFYTAGTSDAKTVYADKDLTTSLGSIVFTDSAGYPVTASGSSTKTLVFTDVDPYKIIIKDGNGVTIATHDNVVGAVVAGTGGGTEGITEAEADARYVRNPVALVDVTGLDDTDYVPFWDTSGSDNKSILWSDFKADLVAEMKTAGHIFATGASLLYFGASAPVGWTKDTTHHNKAIRLVNTSGGGTGGTKAFTTAFTTRTIAQANLPNATLSGTTAGGGAHSHDGTFKYYSAGDVGGSLPVLVTPASGLSSGTVTYTTQTEVNHTHTFTTSSINGGVSQTTFDIDVNYVDAIIIIKS